MACGVDYVVVKIVFVASDPALQTTSRVNYGLLLFDDLPAHFLYVLLSGHVGNDGVYVS